MRINEPFPLENSSFSPELNGEIPDAIRSIAMAEVWWGQSPKSEIRKHGHFYPACTGKCKPILAHMLEGIAMDENPLIQNPAEGK